MQPFNVAVQPEVRDEHFDRSSGEPIVRGLKIPDRLDAGIDLEDADQHTQVGGVGLDNQSFIVRQEWHYQIKREIRRPYRNDRAGSLRPPCGR
jgi:hypothetical protein